MGVSTTFCLRNVEVVEDYFMNNFSSSSSSSSSSSYNDHSRAAVLQGRMGQWHVYGVALAEISTHIAQLCCYVYMSRAS